jgi:hypothetical protein
MTSVAHGGSRFGITRRATIIKYNNDGTVLLNLDEGTLAGSKNQFNAPIPSAWSGPNGEFMGGFPESGASVSVNQGQGGEWFVNGYIKSNDVFGNSFISSDTTQMSALKLGRAVIQVKNEIQLFLDPSTGIQAGNSDNFIQINPIKEILSHNFSSELTFTESSRKLRQKVKRDLFDNRNRDILGSSLDSQAYDDTLFTVGLDPLASISSKTSGNMIKNPPLVEDRELVYEFSNNFDILNDQDESERYSNSNFKQKRPRVSKRNMRSDTLSLGLDYPNHLIEITKGTVVDSFGNILDINRNIIPIGKNDDTSLRKSSDKSEAYNRIRTLSRKGIAYHFELNARKGKVDSEAFAVPDITQKSDYARDRSRFFVDIDKEGQFKINVPASSEVGNIPLLIRYENYSILLAKKTGEVNPNEFVKNVDKRDIFLENFAGKANISLSEGPIDRFTDQQIKYGTAFHDITQTCISFQTNSPWLQDGRKYVSYYPNHHLNTSFTPYEKIVSDTIITNGVDANSGGRSGSINCDGMISLNIGANSVDRQSLWVDCAGGVVANIGRDKRGISYAASLDGDFIMQIGGAGIGNSFDQRFENENDAVRFGSLTIHVLTSNGPMVFQINSEGVDISSPGNITLSSQQNILLKANANIFLDAENIVMHGDSTKRIVNKIGGTI